METVFDYLRWRADVPFDADPFNEVDGLILAELAYADLGGIVPAGGEEIALRDVRDGYFRGRTEEEILADKNVHPKSPLLMSGMLSGRRFADLRISFYEKETDPEKNMQFSATCFALSDGVPFIAFRGTDGTLTGWREDFDLSFVCGTEGQRRAAEYLDRVGEKLRVPFRVGGHSKGGNLALYASAFCKESVRDMISAVFSFDGPGFTREAAQSVEYLAVLKKTVSIIPDTSVVGQLLNSGAEHAVVKSRAKGIAQHDGLTWAVERNRFVRTELSAAGRVIGSALGGWIEQMDYSDRRSFTDTVFTLFASTGADTFSDIGGSKLKSAEAIISAAHKLPREKQREIVRLLAMLGQSGGAAAAAEYMNQVRNKKNKTEESV